MKRWFITVDWCGKGFRGILCDTEGNCCVQDMQHSEDEMWEKLGEFALILEPKSEEFSEEEIKEYTSWTPLEEYSNKWGVARKENDHKFLRKNH